MERRHFLRYSGLGLAVAPLKLNWINTEQYGASPFLEACRKGDYQAVESYIQVHSDWPSERDQDGKSGFALALLNGHKGLGELLKEHGYETDVHEAALDLDWDRFNLLTEAENRETIARVNKVHPVGGSAMWSAARGGAGSGIWRIYAKGGAPDGSINKETGTTPLQTALRYSDLAIAEMTSATLLSNNANPTHQLPGDQPPLHIAVERGSLEIAEMLIRLGANATHENVNGETPLQIAKAKGHQALIDLLTDVTKIHKTCRTSRYAYTATGAKYEIPEAFAQLDRFSTYNFVGKSHGDADYVVEALGQQPLLAHSISTTSEMCIEAGAHMGRRNIVEKLMNAGAPYSLPSAVMMGDMVTVTNLLDEDPNRIHERGAHDFALLWYPIIGRCGIDMMQLLLDRGANVEDQHFLGTTALHWAALGANVEMIEILLANGANINRKGRKFGAEPKTPLQMAREDQIKSFLKERGATE